MNNPTLSPPDIRTELRDHFNLWQLLTVLSWLGMHLAGIMPAWSLISGLPTSWLAWMTFGGIALATFSVSGVLALTHFKRGVVQLVLLFILILSLSQALRGLVFATLERTTPVMLPHTMGPDTEGKLWIAVLATALAVMYLWRRGNIAWQHWIGPLLVHRTFVMGVVLFLVFSLVASATGGRMPVLEFFLFLFTSLLALGGARLSAQAWERGGGGVPTTRSWMIGVSGAAFGVLALAATAALVAGRPAASVLAGLFDRILRGLLSVLLLMLEPLVSILFSAWNFILERIGLGPDQMMEAPQITVDSKLQEQLAALSKEVQPVAWADALGRVLTWLAAFAIAVIVLAWVISSLRGSSKQRQWWTTAGPENPGGATLLRGLRILIGRTRATEQPGHLFPLGRWLAAARIRWIYRQLLGLLARKNIERTPSETPLEYLLRLSNALPIGVDDLANITHAYQRVRYGEHPESRAEVDRVEASWHRIQKIVGGY